MSLLHEKSALVPLPEYDVFSLPGTQAAAEKGWYTTHYPLSPVDATSIIEYQFPTARDEYVHFDRMLFRLKLKIDVVKKGENKITPVSFVNYPLETIFVQKVLQIGDKKVTSSQTTNGYRAIIDTKLGFAERAKKSWMTASMYDEGPSKDEVGTKLLITSGQEIELVGILHFDLTFQDKALLGGLKYYISLLPNVPDFYLKYGEVTPTVTFLESRLEVWKTKVTPLVLEGHLKALIKAPAVYPINRTDTKTVIINPLTYSATIDNVLSGQMPNRVFLTFVSNEAFKGKPSNDPFRFQHFNIDYISVTHPGGTVPTNGYRLDFSSDIYAEALLGLYTAAGQLCNDPRMSISKSTFKNGDSIFGFALAPDLEGGCTYGRHANPIRYGSLRIEVHFKEQLKETLTMIVYSQYDNLIMINRDLNVATDY